MNVNGSRFQLLLGEADWGRCWVEAADGWQRLADAWAGAAESPPASLEPAALAFDHARGELRLQGRLIELGATPGEIPFSLEGRRAAAADRNGNLYWIDADRSRLRVWSVGSDRESAFWPVGNGSAGLARGDFAPVATQAQAARTFTALAVTEDHYLVAAFTSPPTQGLLAFDLMAGGPPVETLWPTALEFAPFDMAKRCGGGVWVLDREHARLWELDRRLAVVSRGQPSATLSPAEADPFQPLDGPMRERPAAVFPAGLDLRAAASPGIDPIAVEALDCRRVLILDRNQSAGSSRLFCLRREGEAVTAQEAGLGELAHDFVVAKAQVRGADVQPPSVLVATAPGNQALGFHIDGGQDAFGLRRSVELFPLRRFSGRALLEVRGTAWYDSGVDTLRWTPVVQQPRVRYLGNAVLVTPVFDGAEPQCVWDRVMLDACIPHDSRIEVWCRCSDERSQAAGESGIIGGWALQPQAYLRGDGAELPWLRDESVRGTRPESGTGTWELLLQNMRGRYLQLKLVFSGNEKSTPWLRAMRAWFPRFSYPQRFLPAVYRENPQDADFIERFLANMEGVNTTLEGRIAQMQALLDPRCAPDEALDWLASWFDVALDPNWEDWRRRLFIRHAVDFFQWRGTAHGLRLALSLAFENCLDDAVFQVPGPASARPQAIRIVESYLTRRVGAVAAGDPGGTETGPVAVKPETLWTPKEGNAGLVDRYAGFLGQPAGIQQQLAAFDLGPPSDAGLSDEANALNQARWRQFCEQNLGFVPGVGALERQRWQRFQAARADPDDTGFAPSNLPVDWPADAALAALWKAFCGSSDPTRVRFRWQDFLARRYRRIERLNSDYHTAWPAFDWVALPDRLPETAQAQTDWLQFEKQLLAMARTAHRFSVLLPVHAVTEDPFEMDRRLRLARRIVELEKPAHTVFDVRFYWALNRVGEARLGLDTLLDVGSRAPALIPDTVLGRAYVGASFVGGPKPPTDGDRHLLAC